MAKKVKIKMLQNCLGQDVSDQGVFERQKNYEKDKEYEVHPDLAENLLGTAGRDGKPVAIAVSSEAKARPQAEKNHEGGRSEKSRGAAPENKSAKE